MNETGVDQVEVLTSPVFYVVLGAAALFFVIQHHAGKRRTTALLEMAQQLGFEFEASGDEGIIERFSDIPLFDKGRSKKVRNLMTKRRSRVVVMVFDYRFTQGSGKNSRTRNQTVVAFESPRLDLPAFECRPENVFHKIGQVFGYQDIDFEEDPEFSKSTVLRGEDVLRIEMMMNGDIRNFIKHQKVLSIEGKNNLLVVYQQSKKIEPDRIVQAVDTAESLHGMLV
jgi:hypothetical protein